jgi:hypothetical protein
MIATTIRTAASVLVFGAGLAQAQTISGVVFWDRNNNGIRDEGELGLANVSVSDQDTVVRTNAAGVYQLPAGRGHGFIFVSVPDGFRSVGSFWRKASEASQFALAPRRVLDFRFIHASDTHISQESAPRMRRLRAVVDSIAPAFLLISGDLVRDALRVNEGEATGYYELFGVERNLFKTPVFTVPGNHEIFGIERERSRVDSTHALFGKAMYRSYLGPDYYSFTHGGVHFVALNTVDVHGDRYYGHVDSLQLAWLERDLARLPPNTPVVTFNHIPFYTTSEIIDGYRDDGAAPTVIDIGGKKQFRHTVSNAAQVLAALAKRRHVLALGGHVHIRELIDFGRDGERTRFENGAAIVGPSQTNIGVFPSGFTVYTVFNGVIDAGRFVKLDP